MTTHEAHSSRFFLSLNDTEQCQNCQEERKHFELIHQEFKEIVGSSHSIFSKITYWRCTKCGARIKEIVSTADSDLDDPISTSSPSRFGT